MTTSEAPYLTTNLRVYSGEDDMMAYLTDLDEQREKCPVLHSSEGPGYWVLTRMDDMREALRNPRVFSNQIGDVVHPNPGVIRIPEMLDPPEHTKWRQLLAPLFSPGQIRLLEDKVRSRAVELIEPLVELGTCDFKSDFAEVFPTSIFLELMGLPVGDRLMFLGWEHDILNVTTTEDPNRERATAAVAEVTAYFTEVLKERRRSPKDDLISVSANWKIDDKPIGDEDLLSLYLLLFMAGLDTVTCQLAWSFWHLATYPEDRRRIVEDPGLIDNAVEEMLRVYTIVRPSRRLTADTEIAGCPMKKGDLALLPLASASRDPRFFPNGEKVLLDRGPTGHIAFGAGPHRCLGSHLARRELKIALEEWHKRIPDYAIPQDAIVREYAASELGVVSLPLAW